MAATAAAAARAGVPALRTWYRPDGDAGAVQTLHRMAYLVRRGSVHPAIVEQARAIILPASRYDRPAQARLIRDWIDDHTKWIPDPHREEWLYPASRFLARIQADGLAGGDCDDVAVLAGSLARAVGFPVRLVAVGFQPRRNLVHVFSQANTGGSWYSFDTTRPARGRLKMFSRATCMEV